ncbi:WD40-repeat-containing domain protein [Chaetomium tenue]|uniref:WD40-repeat-containing domain protein n=1 Tax=Chaetomium tenue TaxID=1854479 RepID=A0ACB7P6B8_9PEZI|nr:WD40-repeat-containing domain protein [Chaetomium globosum]
MTAPRRRQRPAPRGPPRPQGFSAPLRRRDPLYQSLLVHSMLEVCLSLDFHLPPSSLLVAIRGYCKLLRFRSWRIPRIGRIQSSPRSTAHASAANNRSQASTTPQSTRSPVTKSPARLSRNSTSTVLLDIVRGKDRDAEGKDVGETSNPTTATAGTTNGTTSSVDIARQHPASGTAHTPSSNSAIDPLSQHIFMRKNTEPSIPQRLTQMAEGLTRASSEFSRNAIPTGELPKDKSGRKGSSFLSRLNIRGGRKKDLGDPDSDSELGSEAPMDGINARVFSQTLGSPLIGGGYVPRHKGPPRYIRTRPSNKRTREFNRMFLAQELVGTRPPEGGEEVAAEAGKAPTVSVSVAGVNDRKTMRTGGAIWATEFSKDGRFLATAGRDHVVRVWAVLSTPEERHAYEEDEAANGGAGERLSAPVFRDQPVMEFRGHTGEVLDLSWSKNNFLLSSSMDKTVRLWHMSRSDCLCAFKHKDFVTRLAFHPRDDRFFLAGSLDTMLRLWSIPDKAVAFSAQLPDLVTAVAFSPDGKVAIAGLLNGLCMFYETEGLKLSSQVHVRSSRGKNAKGSKITGIQTMTIPPPNPLDTASLQPPGSAAASVASTDVIGSGEVRVLITSNDSRIRIYTLRDKSLDVKLKGHENLCSQIAATFSDDGKHVICGSEDRKTFIWSLSGSDAAVLDKDKSPCEYFEAHGDIVTTALFAPTRTRMLLSHSGDPIYDLCNPPPVVLQSLEEAASAAASQVALTNDSQPITLTETISKRPELSPAYITRSTHYDGHIIVTTGDTGIIKIFRQDCAFAKRRNESWETGSTFSRKLNAGSGYVGGGLGRSGSIRTRTSAGSTAHSRRGSLSQPLPPNTLPNAAQLHAAGIHSDRILSWRQGIDNDTDTTTTTTTTTTNRRSALLANGGGGASTPAARSERSLSPTKASRTSLNSAYNLASEARKQPYAGASARHRASSALTSPAASVFSSPPRAAERVASRLVKEHRPGSARQRGEEGEERTVPPQPGFTLHSAAEEVQHSPAEQQLPAGGGGGTGNTSFWNLGRWRFKGGSSSGGGVGGLGNARRKSSGGGGGISAGVGGGGGRPSLSKSRHQTEGEGEVEGGEAVEGVVDGERADGKGDGGEPPHEEAQLHGDNHSDLPSVPVNSGAEKTQPQRQRRPKGGVEGDGEGVSFQGHSHARRLSSM